MQERVKTSFIPKQSLKVDRAPRRSGGGSMGIVNIVAVFILVLSLIGSAGVFLYEQFLKTSISSKRESLERARAAFEPATIKELARLNTRLSVGQQLLNAHMSYSRVFDEIELLTLQNVRFSEFNLSEVEPGVMGVAMKGSATSFNTLALQADAFGRSRVIQNPIFSDFNVDQFGAVIFSFVGTLNQSELAYTPRGSAPQAAPTAPAPAQEAPPSAAEQNEETL